MSGRLPIIRSREHEQRYLFVRDIYYALPLRNDAVRFYYYGQFNGHDMTRSVRAWEKQR
ncbi:hypothetical protein ACE1CM_26300 [Microseira sp. BLCC-F43]